jgi:TetR/AcrR family transcriptional repressor of nem operon
MPVQTVTMPGAASPGTHRTYEMLLDAGVAVAEREGLAGLSVNRVVAEAGVAKGTFYVHFADREAFVDALHARFHERVAQAVATVSADTPPGAERIVRGVEAYLDVCLADRAVKALALEARTDAALTVSMSARHERAAALRGHAGAVMPGCSWRTGAEYDPRAQEAR